MNAMEKNNSITICGIVCKATEKVPGTIVESWKGFTPNQSEIQVTHIEAWRHHKEVWRIDVYTDLGSGLVDPVFGDSKEDLIEKFEEKYNQSSF